MEGVTILRSGKSRAPALLMILCPSSPQPRKKSETMMRPVKTGKKRSLMKYLFMNEVNEKRHQNQRNRKGKGDRNNFMTYISVYSSLFLQCVLLFLRIIRIELDHTIWTETMCKFSFAMFLNITFYLLPIPMIISDLLARSTNWNQPA
jgi:hypothetical protein